MGWTFPYGATRRQIIDELTPAECPSGDAGGLFRTLRHCCKGNVLYALHESVKPDGSSTKWIGVYLMGKHGGNDWGYKDMDETMGPYYYNCPVKYLDEADEPANECAANWRAEVRRRAAERASKRPRVGEYWKLRDGCRPPTVRVTSVRPLRGESSGISYRLPRKYLDCRVDSEPHEIRE